VRKWHDVEQSGGRIRPSPNRGKLALGPSDEKSRGYGIRDKAPSARRHGFFFWFGFWASPEE